MLNKKSLFTKLAAVSMVASMMLATQVMAATNDKATKTNKWNRKDNLRGRKWHMD